MNVDAPAERDAAWAIIETPLPPSALAAFCADLERLYRINPCLEFRFWRWLEPGRIRTEFTNLSNGTHFEQTMTLERLPAHGFRVVYSSGIKRSTTFEIRPVAHGSSLTITDDYAADSTTAPQVRDSEIDRSLHAWGVAVRDYLDAERRWGWVPGWSLYQRRLWLPMKPSGRRISALLVLITLAEFAFFVLIAVVYWLEQQR